MGATTGAAISSRKGQRAAPYEGMGVLAQAGVVAEVWGRSQSTRVPRPGRPYHPGRDSGPRPTRGWGFWRRRGTA
jgi:hypothetical protein